MSNLESRPVERGCGGVDVLEPSPPPSLLEPREVPLGGPRAMLVRRTLPHRDIRTIGAWCFVDHYGVRGAVADTMSVPPHPHIGLQTVSWLLEGEVAHRDSVGNAQVVRPGELNLMTAGRGIAHSEYSLADQRASVGLFGIQLWVALPEAHRAQAPHFEHHDDLPTFSDGELTATVLLGELAGVRSPAATYSPILGAELRLGPGAEVVLDLERDLEHGLLAADGDVEVDGSAVPFGTLRYQGWGRSRLHLSSRSGATALLLGGEPLAEQLLMWWNFVARSHEEIVAARQDWQGGRRFGAVVDDEHAPLPAPELPNVALRPRPSRRPGTGSDAG